MATRKSPARGTGSRPAKATTAIRKPRAAAKKPLEVSAKAAAPEAESKIVPLTKAESVAASTDMDTVLEPLVEIDEPVAAEPVAKPEAVVEEEPQTEVAETVEAAEAIEEPEVEAPSKPYGAAAFFPGFPGMPDMTAFTPVDMSAFIASGNAVVEGAQSFGDELMAYSRQAFERNVQTTMAMFGASSLEEVIDLQSRHTMGSIDEMLNESAKLAGMAIAVANKAASPFTRG